ncbi:MAG: hypothetical protein R6U98_13065, partial [Pirellulaceae bacterium]
SSCQGQGKRLLDRALDALRNAGFDSANATGYVSWMRQYIPFHDKRHPQGDGNAGSSDRAKGNAMMQRRGFLKSGGMFGFGMTLAGPAGLG